MKKRTMLGILLTAGIVVSASALQIGDEMVDTHVKMQSIDNATLTLSELRGEKGTLVIFTCNKCPFVEAWQKVMVDGPDTGPISQPLAFHLFANGIQLTPSSFVDPTLPGNGFQEISRTYDAAAIAAHVGSDLSIVLGVEDANDAGNRVIFDDVSLDVVAIPEPGTPLLVALAGVLVLAGHRRRK